jgi:hypothetical protein
MEIVANFAKFIVYTSFFRSSVPMAGTPEFLYRNSTWTRMLAADLLLIQPAAETAQPGIAIGGVREGQ